MTRNGQTPEPTEPSGLMGRLLDARIWLGRQRVVHRPQTGKPVRTLIIAEILASVLLANFVSSPHLARTSSSAAAGYASCISFNRLKTPSPLALNLCAQLFGINASNPNASPAPDPPTTYSAFDLGSLDPNGFSTPGLGGAGISNPLNSVGEVAGTTSVPGGNTHAFLWTVASGMVDLGTLGGTSSGGLAINDYGQVVGDSWLTNFSNSSAFLWQPNTTHGTTGTMVNIGGLPGADSNEAVDINSSGQIAGSSFNSVSSSVDAFRWSPTTPNGTSGSLIDLGSLPGQVASSALGINASGEVVGISGNQAFIWTPSSGMVQIGTAPAGGATVPVGLNDYGQVLIIPTTPCSGTCPANHTFLWTPAVAQGSVGTLTDLGVLATGWSSIGTHLNNGGAISGWGYAPIVGGPTQAFVWNPSVPNGIAGQLTGLATPTGQTSNGNWINDSGVVAGTIYAPGLMGTAVTWTTPSAYTILGSPTGDNATAAGWVNNNGQFAGVASNPTFFEHAAFWTPGPPPPPPPPPVQPPPTGGVLGANKTAGGGNPSNPNTKQATPCVGGPIDTENGSMWHTCTDLNIPGRGIELNFARTYNSVFANQDSPVGSGWSFSYGMSLSQDSGTGTVTINQENGSQVTFNRSGSTYSADPWVIATLTKNTDGGWTFVREAQITFTFDQSGRLTSESDLNGYQTKLAYNQASRLVSITDQAGRSLNLAYAGTHISTITDPINRKVQLNYDFSGNLTSYVDVQGNTTSFSYDQNHLMLSMTDPRGGVTTNVFDSQSRATSQTDPMGRKTTLVYSGDPQSATGGSTTITDPKGNVTQEQYVYGFRVSIASGVGTAQAATSQFLFDPNSLGMTSASDPNSNTSMSTFDASGNLLTSKDALNRATASTYNQFNEPLTSTDGNGITTTYAYDNRGNLLSVSRPLTQSSQVQTTAFKYQDPVHQGDITAKVDPNGNTWTYSYDKFGNQASFTDPLGNKSSATFNKIGFKLSSTTPKGNLSDQSGKHPQDGNRDDNNDMDGSKDSGSFTTTFKYNNYGDLLITTDPLGHTQSSKYDANRNVIEATDGNGNVTKNIYDPDNELVQVNRADGTQTKTTYNADGTVAAQIDAKGNATTYAYDSLARTVSSADPLGRVTRYSYDGAGNLIAMVDPKSQTTSYKYDAANQLTGVTYSDGLTPNVSNLHYDGNGNRLSMTDGTGTSAYTFDSMNRLTSSQDGAGAIVGYSYDLDGNLTGLNYPGNHQVSRTFDQVSRMSSVSDWLGNAETFSYDQNSNLTTTNFPGSTNEIDKQAFDNADNLISIVDTQKAQTLASFFYRRDGNNQVTSESSKPGGGNGDGKNGNDNSAQGSKNYSYTALNQLQKVNGTSYSYDPSGNLVQLINGNVQVFDQANQLVSGTASGDQGQRGNRSVQSGEHSVTTTFSYDQNGNRASATSGNGTVTYGFDQANRMTSIGSVATYSYNGIGLRETKTMGNQTLHFTWGMVGASPPLLSDSQNYYVYGPGDSPLEQIPVSGNVSLFHHDQLGSTRLLTDSQGKTMASFAFDPYGNLTQVTGQTTTPLLFAGQYSDSESGLYYLRARYYEPTTGQFLSRDPMNGMTKSPYGYVNGNPLNAADPSGLKRVDDYGPPIAIGIASADPIGPGQVEWTVQVLGAPLRTLYVYTVLQNGAAVIGPWSGNTGQGANMIGPRTLDCQPGSLVEVEIIPKPGQQGYAQTQCPKFQTQTNQNSNPNWWTTPNPQPQFMPGLQPVIGVGYKPPKCGPSVAVL